MFLKYRFATSNIDRYPFSRCRLAVEFKVIRFHIHVRYFSMNVSSPHIVIEWNPLWCCLIFCSNFKPTYQSHWIDTKRNLRFDSILISIRIMKSSKFAFKLRQSDYLSQRRKKIAFLYINWLIKWMNEWMKSKQDTPVKTQLSSDNCIEFWSNRT